MHKCQQQLISNTVFQTYLSIYKNPTSSNVKMSFTVREKGLFRAMHTNVCTKWTNMNFICE